MNDAQHHPTALGVLSLSALDSARFPEFRDRIVAAEARGPVHEPRSYPGYPRTELPRPRPRALASLDRALQRRRSLRELPSEQPNRMALARLLWLSHGITLDAGRGPVPSAGNLQALELFVATLDRGGWLPPGVYHYDRAGHHLSELRAGLPRERWRELVPSLTHFSGGSLLFLIVGDARRVDDKYGARAARLLLLEAGHLMQNLCLVAGSLGLAVLPLGGLFERAIERELALPKTDALLYAGAC